MDTCAPQATSAQRGLLAPLRHYPLFSYFFIAYMISWLGWLPLVLSQTGLGLLPFRLSPAAILAGALGPIGSGFLLTATTSGKAGLRSLLSRFILWRVGVQWYGFAVFGIPVLFLLGILVAVPGALASFHFSTLPSAFLLYVSYLIVGLFISPLAEEPGWRGFALPRLQASYGPLRGSAILGLLWGGWHFPLFLIPGYNGAGTGFLGVSIPFVAFLFAICSGTIVITWVFNHTRESLFIALLIHSAINGFPMPILFPHINIEDSFTIASLVGFGPLAILVLIVTRGKLGYQGNSTSMKHDNITKDQL